jgi:DNA-binding transcriptional regulator YdaS (Cro superfamily)
MDIRDGMKKARRAAGGRDADIARLLGITASAVSRWNGRVPANRAIEIETLTRGRVTRYEIRPDHFGAAPAAGSGAVARRAA